MREASTLPIERSISNVVSNPNLFNVSPPVEVQVGAGCSGQARHASLGPMGPSLYTFKGAVYDRGADADVRVMSGAQINLMMPANRAATWSEPCTPG